VSKNDFAASGHDVVDGLLNDVNSLFLIGAPKSGAPDFSVGALKSGAPTPDFGALKSGALKSGAPKLRALDFSAPDFS
jgi:hypothetical protein